MRAKFKTTFVFLIVIGAVFLLLYSLSAQDSYADDLIIICNQSVPVDSLSKSDIQRIFLGKKTEWFGGNKIAFVLLSDKGEVGEVHNRFLQDFMGKTPTQYKNYWKKMVFTGKGRTPKSFKTSDELIDYVSKTAGAIGYISTNAQKETVKTIQIFGN